ncbi:MAG: IS1 family transposase [Chloroflexi bacterium]|nr:IS1 family transposase [Chloroflexota bacterium]
MNQEPSTPGFGYSQLEDRLRRLQRKTKGYSKSVAMLRGSIALIYLKLGLI